MSVACLECQRLRQDLHSAEQAIQRAMHRGDAIRIDLENAETDLKAKRRIISELRAELEDKREEAPEAQDADKVFEYWRVRLHPAAKSFKGKRRVNVMARLADKPQAYTVRDLFLAVDGAVLDAWTGPNGVRHDDLEFICRDPSTTDRFIKAALAEGSRIAEFLCDIGGGPYLLDNPEMDALALEFVDAHRALRAA